MSAPEANLPETLDRGRHRDPERRDVELWVRRAGIVLLVALLCVALAGVFGQSGETLRAAGAAATLRLDAPRALRSGLMYQARITIEAHRALERPLVVLESGWLDGMTVNSLEPAPVDETERNGFLALGYDALAAGDSLTVYVELQANPTTVGDRTQTTLLEDGGRVLARIDRSITVFP